MLCASAAALQASFGGLGMAALATTPRLLAVAGPLTSASAMHHGLFNARAYATVDADTKAPGANARGPQPHEQLHAPPKSVQLDSPSFASGAVAPHPGIKASFAASGAAAPHVASPLAATPSPLAAPHAAAPSPDDAVPESHMPHPAYSPGYLETVRPSHVAPEKVYQHVGFTAIRIMRTAFDKATGYSSVPGAMTEAAWLRRIVFLETVAGVPGMVAGMQRHLRSLRSMQRDMGWIHTLLEEAENERMHLLTFLQLRQPGPLFRAAVIAAQGVFFNAYFLAYLISPRTCHAFVGFLEEEAVKTYTHALAEIDAGRLWKDRPAPPMAVQYWGLPPGANMRDLVLAVRADEACHAHVNHTLSRLQPEQVNPFANGASQLP